MLNIEETKSIIWNLMNCLRGLIFSPDRLSGCAVRLLFLKYAVDNSIGATDVESMQYCAKAQKMFAIRDTENGLDTIIPVLNNIDRAYGMFQIVSDKDIIEHYAGELFGMNRLLQKKNVNDHAFKQVMDYLGSLDLEEAPGSKENGRMLVNGLIQIMASTMEGSKIAAERGTSPSLAKVAKSILNVAGHDTFLDFTSGNGISTIEITGNALPRVTLVDLDHEAAATSAMLMIMYGYTHFRVFCENTLTARLPGISGNKIFADVPFGLRLEKTPENDYSDGTIAAIDKLIHGYMSQDGIAVITSPSGPLYRSGPAAEIKNEIVTLGLLHAVVALPPMWGGASIGTNLLVFGRKPSRSILFVDASDRAVTTAERKKAKLSNLLSEETIQEITNVVLDPQDIPGFARVVAEAEIRTREYNLVPANYITKQAEEDTTTLAEIDDQLADLYRQLNL